MSSVSFHTVGLTVLYSGQAQEKPKPTLRVYPHTTVYTGDALTLTCDLQISLTGWRFTWFKVSQQLESLGELGPNTLSITASDSGTTEYLCQAFRGSYGSDYSDGVKITVRERPKATVKVQPAERVFIRERVTLTCDIESGGVWNYEWFKNNDPLSEAQWRKNYEISNADGSHEGDYTCKGRRSTEPHYSEISAAVRLTVSEDIRKPTLRVDPHTTVYTGDTLTLTYNLQSSLTGWRFRWYKVSQQLNPLTEYKDTNTLSITVSDTGTAEYQCVALRGDYVSHYSAPVKITVRERPKATVKVQPAERVFITQRVTLTCEIESGGVWNYEWFKNNDPLSEAQQRKNYEISNADGSHEGDYTCKGRRSTEPRYSEISPAVRLTVSEKPKPTLRVDPHTTVYTGDTLTLTCDLQSSLTGWRFTWYKVSDHLESLRELGPNTLSITSSDSGTTEYQCIAYRGSYDSQYSDPVRITVREGTKPVLSIKPEKDVFRGETVTLRCDIQVGGDTEWKYSWIKSDPAFHSHSTTQEYTISPVTESNSGKYTCRGVRRSDSQLSEISDAVTLTVFEKPKPTLRVYPHTTVYTGDTLTLTCDLQISLTGWRLRWYKVSQQLNPLTEYKDTNTLSITVSDTGTAEYQCVALRGDYVSRYSAPVRITVRDKPKATVKVQPAERVFIRERVTLTCDIESGGVWSYEWFKNNDPLSEAQWRKNYEISNVDGSHEGDYTCKGRRSTEPRYSEISAAVRLSVSVKSKPELRSRLKGAALRGSSVTLECVLDQSAGWRFYWTKHTQNPQNEFSTETRFHTISSVSVPDGGQYWCRAGRGNPVNYTPYSDALWVNVTESAKSVVSIKPDKDVFRGETVTLRCDIQAGGDTEWKYSWIKSDPAFHSHSTTQEYTISPVTESNSGKYTCRGESDSQLSEISDTVTLTVFGEAQAVLSVSPQSWLTEGDSVTLSCEVRDSSTGWTFSWYRDGEELHSDSRREAGGSYTLSAAALHHTGVYECRAKRGEAAFHTQYSNLQPLWITASSPPVSLITSPSRTQHFINASLSLSCEGQSDSTGWRVRRYTHSRKVSDCTSDWGSVTESVCSISSLSTSHTGVYWCQSESGGRSHPVIVIVHNSDSGSNYLKAGVAAVSSLIALLIIILSLVWCHKKNKDAPAGPSEVTYAEIDLKSKKKMKKKQNLGYMSKTLIDCGVEGSFLQTQHPSRATPEASPHHRPGQAARGSPTFHPNHSQEKPTPALRVYPHTTVYTGDTLTLTCDLQSSLTGWRFRWFKVSQQLNPLTAEYKDTNTLSITVSDSGTREYLCIALRGGYYSHYSDPVKITVKKPTTTLRVDPHTTVYTGDKLTLTCDLQSSLTGWRFKWYKVSQQLNPLTDEYKDINTLSITVSDTGTAEYQCVALRGDYYSHYSDPFRITVRAVKPKPELRSGLKGAALRGSSVTLECVLDQSAGWRFYWTKRTQNPQNEFSTETRSHTISSVSVSDEGQYWCRAGRGDPVNYTLYSDALWVNVTEPPKPLVSIKPAKDVFRGETVTLRCDIQVGGDTEWKYSWIKSDPAFQSHSTTQEYTISPVTESYSGKYTCRGERRSDSQLSEISEAVTLTVFEKPTPTLRVDPHTTVYTGDTLTLTCDLQSSLTGWRFTWFKVSQQLESLTEYKDTNTLSITVSDTGTAEYQCVARKGDYDSHYSAPVRITVESAKSVVSIKPDKDVFRGEPVTLRCDIQVGGDTEWKYNWFKSDPAFHSHSTTQEYTISPVTEFGKYTCRGERRSDSQLSEISDAVTLTVFDKPKPELRSRLKGAALRGNSVTLECVLDQSAGWRFYWTKHTQNPQNEFSTETRSHTISSVSVSDGGQYWCRAGRGNPVYYTPYSDALWVNITESAKSVLSIKPDKDVFRGETVTLRCDIQAGGDTEWKYNWIKSDPVFHSHSTTQEYTISPVTESNSGKYTCRGERRSDSQLSEISEAVTLTVFGEAQAVLSVSPQSWLTEGDSVTLSCEVRDSSTGWTFSWYRDGEELHSDSRREAGGSYTLSAAALHHTGVYECKAKRGEPAFHTQYSNLQPLWITASPPPVSLIISPSRTQHFINASLSLSCKGQSESTGWRVSRYTHSGKVSDCTSGWGSVTGSTCSISSLSTSHTGVYWCQSESGGRSRPVIITVHSLSSSETRFSVLSLLSSLLAMSPYLLVSIILGVKCYRARAQPDEVNRT
ncbi:basement membrane-specific heparan sulfate proteoglycan core protein-like [Salminus brasiliensis]|uniref:basement membrane-specific heparan sulfate proteoglycan core protein-like n=1 Tax=Salminus brasiliensis TaxID=930266 RepID=UPI003B838149